MNVSRTSNYSIPSLSWRVRCGYLLILLLFSLPSLSQTCTPTASYILADGEESTDASDGQSAPVVGHFEANPSNVGDYSERYEWLIYEPGKEKEPIVHRFGETLDYTFAQSGTFLIQLYATFIQGTDTIGYPEEGAASPFTVSIAESELVMPNAFSPNKEPDGWNDEYKVKTHKSIVEFHAVIFNRWGQRLYSWDDVNGKWDGRVNGRIVPDGVYFVNVVARGADGRKYHIRKDINVITGYKKNGEGGGTN